MARVSRIIDDLTGAELNEDVDPTTITVDGQDYELDLGSASKERLVQWLKGEGSLVNAAAPRTTSRRSNNSDKVKEHNKKVRAWAIASGFKYEGADGKERTLGDRGSIPQVVLDAYDKAVANGEIED